MHLELENLFRKVLYCQYKDTQWVYEVANSDTEYLEAVEIVLMVEVSYTTLSTRKVTLFWCSLYMQF
jgi:hypothetical protein